MTKRKAAQLAKLGYVKRFGDRKDGRRVRDLDAMHKFMPYVMPNRCDAEVYMKEELDVTRVLEYIAAKNAAPDAQLKTTLFHATVAALSKVVSARPLMNRFISAKRTFQRDKLTFGFIAKKQFNDKGHESLMILNCRPEMNLDDVSHKIVGEVRGAREDNREDNTADDTLDLLVKLPRCLINLFMVWQRWSDYFRCYPKSLMDADTNFVSVLISNLGSIGCDACYHHLQNLGTNSIVITIGVIHPKVVLREDGTTETRQMANFAFTLDERIGDGFYFARTVRMFDYLLQHPELLEEPAGQPFEYASK